jgi:hypothetical protein
LPVAIPISLAFPVSIFIERRRAHAQRGGRGASSAAVPGTPDGGVDI